MLTDIINGVVNEDDDHDIGKVSLVRYQCLLKALNEIERNYLLALLLDFPDT